MNKHSRKELEIAISLIENAEEIVRNIRDDEQEKFENLSEGLKQSEKGQKFEEAISALDDVLDHLQEVTDGINLASE